MDYRSVFRWPKEKKKKVPTKSKGCQMIKTQQTKPHFCNYHLYSNRSKLITGLDMSQISDSSKPSLHLLKCTPFAVGILVDKSIKNYFFH